jgi:RNA polymerase sigma-70 factor (ECF subfamily)
VDDSELVKDILDGKVDSFNVIIYKYESSIFKFILTMVKDGEEAKDLTQEVFITMYNKLYTYRGQSKFSSWLYQIARNKSMDYLRKTKGVIKLSIENAWDVSSKELLPEQWLEFKETKNEVQNFIKCLDDTTRQILILKGSNEDFKFADIAEILNINVGTVKTKYYRLWDKYNSFINEERCKAL